MQKLNNEGMPPEQTDSPQHNPIMLMANGAWRAHVGPKASLFDQVESLPEDEKLVLVLHYYEGLSFAEIGTLMEMQEWDAVVLHAHALNRLEIKLNEIVE